VKEYTSTPPSHTTSPQEPKDTRVLVAAGVDVPSSEVSPPEGRTVTLRTPTAVAARNAALLVSDTDTAVTIRVIVSSQVPL